MDAIREPACRRPLGGPGLQISLSLALIALLCVVLYALSPRAPRAALSGAAGTVELAALEDRFAKERGDLDLARRLAGEYLRLGHAAFAIATVRAAPPDLLEDPLLTRRLAIAYEHAGRLRDAFATAQLARARCMRAVGVGLSLRGTPPPAFHCTPGLLVQLEMHEHALGLMLRFGVTDPRTDPRAVLAHRLADRRTSIASLAR